MHRLVLVVALGVVATEARAVSVLTVGKRAVFRDRGGTASALVTVGRDRAFATLADPTCGGGDTMRLQVASYPTATFRVDAQDLVELPCAGWKKRAGSFVYRDPAGSVGGVRKVVYGHARLLARFQGGSYRPIPAPVGYAELWIEIGGKRLLARFHNFRRNEAGLVVSRKPSSSAATGEAAFWDVLHGTDASEGRESVALHCLERSIARDRKDGRSHFLLAMLHLYRFAQSTMRFDQVAATPAAELAAANRSFEAAVPLLWNGTRGDSRVPGFAAGAKFALGIARGDDGLAAAGLGDLEAAVAVNPFFNVFDLIPVAQAVSATDARYARVFELMKTYLEDPDTLACVVTQPEICADRGLAPRNVAGALMLFGDLYAKAAGLDPANVAQAETWYAIAAAGASVVPGYRFADALAARVGHAAERAALYLDADPSNDPLIIGAGPEACASCHNQ